MKRALFATLLLPAVAGVGIAIAADTTSEPSGSAVPARAVGNGAESVVASETWGFEPAEGFVPGWMGGQAGWIAPNSTIEGHIDTVNPHSGTQHLRISNDPAAHDDSIGAISPTVTDPSPDPSSMSVWVAITFDGESSYIVQLQALSQQLFTATLMFSWDGSIEVADWSGMWVDTGFDWTPGAYVQLVIDVDPAGDTITYWYGGTQIFSQSVGRSTVIERVTLLRDDGDVGSGYADFDDLVIERGSVEPTLHRWSFTTDGSDPVGGADAVLVNGAHVSGGALVLDGVDDYAELPIADTLKCLTDVSVEAWVVWQGATSWERIFDFGDDTTRNWFMTPCTLQTGMPRVAITDAGIAGEQRTDSSQLCPLNERAHLVFTLDGDGTSDQGKLYINGAPVGTYSGASALDPRELGRLGNLWLGRSQYPQDPFFMGKIEEFAIYGTVLTELQVLDLYRVFADGFESGGTDRWSATVP